MGLITALKELVYGNANGASREIRAPGSIPSLGLLGVVEDAKSKRSGNREPNGAAQGARGTVPGDKSRASERTEAGKRSENTGIAGSESPVVGGSEGREHDGESDQPNVDSDQGEGTEIDADVTSRIQAIKDVDEICSERVKHKSQEFKAIHEGIREVFRKSGPPQKV